MEELLNELKEERLDREAIVTYHYCEASPYYLVAQGKLDPLEALEEDLIAEEFFNEIMEHGIHPDNKKLSLYGYTELSIGDLKNEGISTEFSGKSDKLYSDKDFNNFEIALEDCIVNTVNSILLLKDNLDERSSIEDLGLKEYEVKEIVKDMNNITYSEKSAILEQILLNDLNIVMQESECSELWNDIESVEFELSSRLVDKLQLPEKLLPERYDSFRIVEIDSMDKDDERRMFALQAGRNKMFYDSIDVFESVDEAILYAEQMYKAKSDDIEIF